MQHPLFCIFFVWFSEVIVADTIVWSKCLDCNLETLKQRIVFTWRFPTFLERCSQFYRISFQRILGGSFSETLCLWSPTTEVGTCPKCGVAGDVSWKMGAGFFGGGKRGGTHSMGESSVVDWKPYLFGRLIEREGLTIPKFFAFTMDFHSFSSFFLDHWFFGDIFWDRHPDVVLQPPHQIRDSALLQTSTLPGFSRLCLQTWWGSKAGSKGLVRLDTGYGGVFFLLSVGFVDSKIFCFKVKIEVHFQLRKKGS